MPIWSHLSILYITTAHACSDYESLIYTGCSMSSLLLKLFYFYDIIYFVEYSSTFWSLAFPKMKKSSERQVIHMASFYSVKTPVYVRAYLRFRLNKWEFVRAYWRALPTR